jgi:hypothetical protein
MKTYVWNVKHVSSDYNSCLKNFLFEKFSGSRGAKYEDDSLMGYSVLVTEAVGSTHFWNVGLLNWD